MNRRLRSFAIAAGIITSVIVLGVLIGFYTLQTGWFREQVRQRVLAAIEHATGGRVELGSFHYDARRLTAEFRNLVVHGTEPAGAPPLFRAASVRVRLTIVSVLKRDIDIASLVVDRPEMYLVTGPGGTTNIPSLDAERMSSSRSIQALLDLKIRHFELRNGLFQVNAQQYPLSTQAEDLNLALSYAGVRPRYNIEISSKKLRFDASRFHEFDAGFNAQAQLERDRLTIERAAFGAHDSKLEFRGSIQHFANPTLDCSLAAQLTATEIARAAGFPQLRNGSFTLGGRLHSDGAAPLAFTGRLTGRDIGYRAGAFFVRNVDIQSDVEGDLQELRLERAVVSALRGRFTGRAVLSRSRGVKIDGTVAGANLQEAAALLYGRALPWAAIAGGTLHVDAPPSSGRVRFTVQSKLALTPASGGIPVSGNIDASYNSGAGTVEFANSELRLPSTQLSISGAPGRSFRVVLDSRNLEDLRPALPLLNSSWANFELPVIERDGNAHFDGTISGPVGNLVVAGSVALAHFRMRGAVWDQLRLRGAVSSDRFEFSSAAIDRAPLHASATGRFALANWSVNPGSPVHLDAQFTGLDFAELRRMYPAASLRLARGLAAGCVKLAGTLDDPQGSAQIQIFNADAYGEVLNRIELAATIAGDELQISRGRLLAGAAVMSFHGSYKHAPSSPAQASWRQNSWRNGELQIEAETDRFPLATLAPVRKHAPGWDAQLEIHARAAASVRPGRIELKSASGSAAFRKLAFHNVLFGSITVDGATRGQVLDTKISGNLRESRVSGAAQVQLSEGNLVKGEAHLDRIGFKTLSALVNPDRPGALPFDGFVNGNVLFEGPLSQPERLHGRVVLPELELSSAVPVQTSAGAKSADLIFRNVHPIVFDAADGIGTVRSFEIAGKDTSLTVAGSVPYLRGRPFHLQVNGSADLRLFELFDPNVQCSGTSVVAASVEGTAPNPAVSGTLELRNGAFQPRNLPNGLTAVNGIVKFDQNRASIQRLTAQTGGGQLSLGGFINFAPGKPVVYRLDANADDVRIRYAGSIGVTLSSRLQLTGTSESSILSGTATISRVVLSPNTDIGNLLAAAAAPAAAPTNQKDFLSGMQLDVRVESAPNLQLNTALSQDVQAEVDLRLRGAPANPILLGTISANQGEIKVFGGKYTINRGEVAFVNPARIEPVLDLDLRTQVRGIAVDITVAGTLGKLNINYRSDPPLQPKDIIALLTVGRIPEVASNVSNVQTRNDLTTLQSSPNTVLGQAISPASNRLSKLFGITNIKIDPMVQGVTNTPQARLTLEQDISRQITVTYVTNLSQTSEQIFRFEWALSPQYSLVAIRDDNGEFGIDIQYKKRFK